MDKNRGREFATMSDEERRRFLQEAEGTPDGPEAELDFENPREERPEGEDGDGRPS